MASTSTDVHDLSATEHGLQGLLMLCHNVGTQNRFYIILIIILHIQDDVHNQSDTNLVVSEDHNLLSSILQWEKEDETRQISSEIDRWR
jgi:hypothetical protein